MLVLGQFVTGNPVWKIGCRQFNQARSKKLILGGSFFYFPKSKPDDNNNK